jgi:hypothetical protein
MGLLWLDKSKLNATVEDDETARREISPPLDGFL